MKEIRCDIVEDVLKFQLVMFPVSCFLKTKITKPTKYVEDDAKIIPPGSIVYPRDGVLAEFVKRIPHFPKILGESIESHGMCPHLSHSMPNSQTKLGTFPTTPFVISVKDINAVILSHLRRDHWKPYRKLPGWMFPPRSDMIEFSCIKLMEIIKYYKLQQVAIPFGGFNMHEGDKHHILRVKEIMNKYLGDEVNLCHPLVEEKTGSLRSFGASSTVTIDEEETEVV